VLFFHGLWWYIPQRATGAAAWLRTATEGGYRGVSLFFILSGLLITNILLNSRSRDDYFASFYRRRALRILPAYYLILALLALYGVSRGFLALSLVYMSNMAPLLGVPMSYGPLWSLAVEEQFYLMWPLIVRRLSTPTLVVLAVGVIVNNGLLSLQLRTNSPMATMPIWYAAHGLAMGALLAIFLRSALATRKRVLITAAALTACGTVILAAPARSGGAFIVTTEGFAWDLVFSAILLFALLIGSSDAESLLKPRVLQFLGDISYGLYLIHVLVFMVYRRLFAPSAALSAILLQFLICSVVSIGLAAWSRFTFEQWFLNRKERPSRQLSVATCVAEVP
jgi:peptidoglycan/LPS O-acetylase OafA/YrhL